jgi:hypothetical protein
MKLDRKAAWVLVGTLVVASIVAGAGAVLGYGKAEHPLAQIAFSGNCDNAGYPFCAPPPAGVGTGGIWLWIEVDAGGTGDVAGAVCGHTIGGVGGRGGAGASSEKGEITWTYSTLAAGQQAGGFFFGDTDAQDHYYLVTLPTGAKFLFPTTTGHSSFQPVPGVTLQLQVAP